MELLHREFEIRTTDLETREVTGIAVPYNEVTQIGRMKEKFMPNSINVTKMPKLFYNHDEPIGIIRSMNDAEDGLHITAKISNTAKGNDAWTLVKDGVVRSFSIGFVPQEQTLDGDVVIRTKVDLKEVSLVALPAYEGSVITQYRNDTPENNNLGETKIMENPTQEAVDLTPAVDELSRRVAVLETPKTTTIAVPKIRTYGEYIKGIVNGDADAQEMYRALTTVGDIAGLTSQQNFVSDIKKIVDLGRPAVAAFSTAQMLPSGVSVFFPQVGVQGATSTVQAT